MNLISINEHYTSLAKSKSLLLLGSTMKRAINQNLRSVLWSLKDHSDEIKSNSIASLMLHKKNYTLNTASAFQQRTALELGARLELS